MNCLIVEFLDFCQKLDIMTSFARHQGIEMIQS